MRKALFIVFILCAAIHSVYAQSTTDEDGCPLTDGYFDPIPGLPPFCYSKYAGAPGPGFPGNPDPIVLNEVTIYPSNPSHPANPANPWYPYVILPVPIPTPSAANPCGVLADRNANQQVKAWINNLRASTGLNYERGAIFYGDNPIPVQGGVNQSGISISVYDKISGFMHSHSAGDLSIYSFDDLIALAQLYQRGLLRDPNSFYYGVFTNSGTGYMLAIENPTLFSAFASNFHQITPGSNPLGYLYNALYVNTSNTPAQNFENFLRFLDQNSSGLKVFEYDGTNKTWTPKKIINNTVTTDPC